MHNIRQDVALFQQLAAALSLSTALICQININPAGEQVLLVPLRLAMAKEY